jgi:hypothetical protein
MACLPLAAFVTLEILSLWMLLRGKSRRIF